MPSFRLRRVRMNAGREARLKVSSAEVRYSLRGRRLEWLWEATKEEDGEVLPLMLDKWIGGARLVRGDGFPATVTLSEDDRRLRRGSVVVVCAVLID